MVYLKSNLGSGGRHGHISKLLKEFGIDTSHFIRNHPRSPSNRKHTHETILIVKDSGYRTLAIQLRRSLIECGRRYECEVCGLLPVWNNMELRLHVDHIDGNYLDSRKENLRFICPNCHTQTKNYCNNKGKTGVMTVSQIKRNRSEVD